LLGGYVVFRGKRFREIEQTPANRCILDREIGPDEFDRLRLAQRVQGSRMNVGPAAGAHA
jgi:hypothetical protein